MEQAHSDPKEGENMATILANPVEMIERGAPRLIHSEVELKAYTSTLFWLSEVENPSPAQVETMELLGVLIEKYETEHHPVPPADPAGVVRFLLDQNNLQQRDLIPEFGSEAAVSMFITGKRQITLDQVRRLSERFHIGPSAFMQL
jgi:HTH-type transcriptional regulator/antitoxin HigA